MSGQDDTDRRSRRVRISTAGLPNRRSRQPRDSVSTENLNSSLQPNPVSRESRLAPGSPAATSPFSTTSFDDYDFFEENGESDSSANKSSGSSSEEDTLKDDTFAGAGGPPPLPPPPAIREPSQPQDPEQKRDDSQDRELKMVTLKDHRPPGVGRTVSEAETQQVKLPWYKKFNPFGGRNTMPVPVERTQISPEYTANFFSLMTFQWVQPLMWTGFRRRLEMNDLYLLNPKRSVKNSVAPLREAFNRRRQAGSKYALAWAYWEVFHKEFIFSGVCRLIADLLVVSSPFVMKQVIIFVGNNYAYDNGNPEGLTAAPSIGTGVGYVVGIFAMQIVQSQGTSHFSFHQALISGQARASFMSLILEKALKLSNRAKAGTVPHLLQAAQAAQGGAAQGGAGAQGPENDEEGKKNKKNKSKKEKKPKEDPGKGGWGHAKTIQIMAADTAKFEAGMNSFHPVWTSPLMFILTLAYLIINLHESALAGFGLLVIGTPALAQALKLQQKQRSKQNELADKRVALTSELFGSISFVKYFAWEDSFVDRLKSIRREEIGNIQTLQQIRSFMTAMSTALPTLAGMISFVTFALINGGINPSDIFSSLALFNALRMPLNMFPYMLSLASDGWDSLMRIQTFLEAEEIQDEFEHDPTSEFALSFDNAAFTWERNPMAAALAMGGGANAQKQKKKEAQMSEAEKEQIAKKRQALMAAAKKPPFHLPTMTFGIGRNELVAVIGTTGCGKSALVQAMTGDMRKTSGSVNLSVSRAYCPQAAWIQNTTVQKNITFGEEFKPEWYKQVVEACALTSDFQRMPLGDQTEIGERGTTVSGGQRQRISIARAVYRNCDFNILDDPLSAVDAHVAKHLFDNVINGVLKNKARVLVTHQLYVLPKCDRIIVMDHGKIRNFDTFENLMRIDKDFADMMIATQQEEQKKAEAEARKQAEGGGQQQAPQQQAGQGQGQQGGGGGGGGGQQGGGQQAAKKKAGGAFSAPDDMNVDVPFSTYFKWIAQSGTVFNWAIILGTGAIAQAENIITNQWLSWWASNKYISDENTNIAVYVSLACAQVFFLFAFGATTTYFGTVSARSYFMKMLDRVVRAPMSFFVQIPLGRIMNRFTKDVDVIDTALPDSMRNYLNTIFTLMSIFALVLGYEWEFIAALVPLIFLFVCAVGFYRGSSKSLKRTEALLRAGVYARFNEILTGGQVIRSYKVEPYFQKVLNMTVDNFNSVFNTQIAVQRWLGIRIDACSISLVLILGILMVTGTFELAPSDSGLILSYILAIVQSLQFSVRQMAEVENNITSVHRIEKWCTELKQEAPRHLGPVDKQWPLHGRITFENVDMRYRPELPLVLKDLNLDIKGGERIGIVGRTGAGKSTIIQAIFRIAELARGTITIDGIDISKIGLDDLRSRLGIIPQDPTLFEGSVRSNCDPFGEYEDIKLWNVLRQVGLISTEPEANDDDEDGEKITLDTIVEEEGKNFSLGQRQLLALARALLRDSQIVIFDEATSAIDLETDAMIQRMVSRDLRGRTLLSIAHRLRTIIGFDRIVVMDKGSIAQVGAPYDLFMQEGIFRGMCEQSGINDDDFDSYGGHPAPTVRRRRRTTVRYDRISRLSVKMPDETRATRWGDSTYDRLAHLSMASLGDDH